MITPALQPIVDAFFSELATLGFIGALAFLLTYNFNPECREGCTFMQKLSQHFLDDPEELQEIFEVSRTIHGELCIVKVILTFLKDQRTSFPDISENSMYS